MTAATEIRARLEDDPLDGFDDTVMSQADRYVWSLHGRGMSTSVGAMTRYLIKDAWLDGYRSALRSMPAHTAPHGKDER